MYLRTIGRCQLRDKLIETQGVIATVDAFVNSYIVHYTYGLQPYGLLSFPLS